MRQSVANGRLKGRRNGRAIRGGFEEAGHAPENLGRFSWPLYHRMPPLMLRQSERLFRVESTHTTAATAAIRGRASVDG